jgi:hypothetical protein
MRNAREEGARRTGRFDLGFHEVSIEAGECAQAMGAMNRVDRVLTGYLEAPDWYRSLALAGVEDYKECGRAAGGLSSMSSLLCYEPPVL